MMREVASMLKDENYFRKRHARLMKQNPIKFMEYIAAEMMKIAKHEGNKKQEAVFRTINCIAQKYV